MITLNLNADLESGVEIADAKAELHDYAIEAAPPGLSLEAYQLTRLDTLKSYRLCRETPHYWSCTCPAFVYRKVRSLGCKHTEVVSKLTPKQKAFLAPLTALEVPA